MDLERNEGAQGLWTQLCCCTDELSWKQILVSWGSVLLSGTFKRTVRLVGWRGGYLEASEESMSPCLQLGECSRL